jgi:hypothetical protein
MSMTEFPGVSSMVEHFKDNSPNHRHIYYKILQQASHPMLDRWCYDAILAWNKALRYFHTHPTQVNLTGLKYLHTKAHALSSYILEEVGVLILPVNSNNCVQQTGLNIQ